VDNYLQLLLYIAPIAIIGLIGWIWALWISHYKHKLHVAENYVKKEATDEIKEELKSLTKMLWRIAGKIGIPVENGD
jgi:hypothetical protein